MPRSRRCFWIALGSALALVDGGCGGGSGRSAGQAESPEQYSIAQVGQLLRLHQKGNKPPPKGVKDLMALERGYSAAIGSLRDKSVLLYWGTGFSETPEASRTILAFQKDVPERGGEVLMQDGTARKMTAEEFRAANKPPGASTETGPAPPAKSRR